MSKMKDKYCIEVTHLVRGIGKCGDSVNFHSPYLTIIANVTSTELITTKQLLLYVLPSPQGRRFLG